MDYLRKCAKISVFIKQTRCTHFRTFLCTTSSLTQGTNVYILLIHHIMPHKPPVHRVPKDLHTMLHASLILKKAWQTITPLARNEWTCWITSAKKPETRLHRLQRTCAEVASGKRRPCCFPGCPHR